MGRVGKLERAHYKHQTKMTVDMKPDNEAIEDMLGLFRTTLERGYKFVLCVETPPPSLTVQQSNMPDREQARMLERFARRTRRDLRDGEGPEI